MANTDYAMGLVPVTGKSGAAPQMHEYTAVTSATIYQGEPLALVSGKLIGYGATATHRFTFVGAAAHPRLGTDSTNKVLVYDDPDQEFEVQLDSASNGVTGIVGLVGVNFVLLTPTSGSSTTYQSSCELDDSSGGAANCSTTILPFVGLRKAGDSSNSWASTHTNVIVKCNPENHVWATHGPLTEL